MSANAYTVICAVLKSDPFVTLVTTQPGHIARRLGTEIGVDLVLDQWYGESVPNGTVAANWIISIHYLF